MPKPGIGKGTYHIRQNSKLFEIQKKNLPAPGGFPECGVDLKREVFKKSIICTPNLCTKMRIELIIDSYTAEKKGIVRRFLNRGYKLLRNFISISLHDISHFRN